MRPNAMASSGSASPRRLTRLRSSTAARGLAAKPGRAGEVGLLPIAQRQRPVEVGLLVRQVRMHRLVASPHGPMTEHGSGNRQSPAPAPTPAR